MLSSALQFCVNTLASNYILARSAALWPGEDTKAFGIIIRPVVVLCPGLMAWPSKNNMLQLTCS